MSAHRYWRLDVSATQAANTLAIAELILRTTVGGSDVAIGCTASASTAVGTHPASLAFDGSAATFWSASSNAEPQWLKADLGSAFGIVEYAIINALGVGLSPTNFTLSYSDDDVTYTVADTETGITWASVGQTQTFDISSGSGNTAAIASSLGALATVAAATATLAAVASCSLGALSCSGTATQANTAAGGSSIGALATSAQAHGSQSAQSVSAIGPLSTAITATQVNVNTAAITATLGALGTSASASQANAAQGVTSLPALTTSAQAQASNTAQASMAMPPLASSLHATGAQFAQATTVLAMFEVDASASATNQADVQATLGPLFTGINVAQQVVYVPDGRYYVQIAARPFYADLEPRSFLAQLPARTFYILSDPNMTPTFDTKDPRETVVLTFDATADLATGETLTAVREVDVTMMRGSDPDASAIVSEEVINPSQITIGSATIAAGHGVQAIASAGLTGCWYLIAITCATSNPDKILTLKGILQVSSS